MTRSVDSSQAQATKRFARDARLRLGADAWLIELVAPLRDVHIGRVSVGSAAEIATFCLRHLREDRAAQIASALAFRTLFGLVPVLVVATLIVKSALGANWLPTLEHAFQALGLQSIHVNVPAENGEVASSIGLDQWLMQIVGFTERLNIAALGWTGFILVAFSAIWVLSTIEEAFNIIFRCERGRSWFRRALVYWFVLTFGPLLLGLMPIATQKLHTLQEFLSSWSWLAKMASWTASLAFLWVMLLGIYMTIPATRVLWKPAMIGALVGAVLIQLGKSFFGFYLANAFGVSALYGSLGLIPLFMFWVYLMWLVILFGAEIAALLQAIRSRGTDEDGVRQADAESVLRTVLAIAERFRDAHTVSVGQIAANARLSTASAGRLLQRLSDAGVVRQLGEEDSYVLARPAESIALKELLELAWSGADGIARAGPLEEKLRAAQRSAVGDLTLRDALLPS